MKNKKINVKLGNEEMAFWRDVIDARKLDIKNMETNMKYYKAILEMAEVRYGIAEGEFNKKD